MAFPRLRNAFRMARMTFDGLRMYRVMHREGQDAVLQHPGLLAQVATDPQTKSALEATQMGMDQRAAAASGQPFDAGAYMRKLSESHMWDGLPTLPRDDARLQPIDGMSFDTFVWLATRSLLNPKGPTMEQEAGLLNLTPGTVEPAFRKWSDLVVKDHEVGMHYTVALQKEVAAQDKGPTQPPGAPPRSP